MLRTSFKVNLRMTRAFFDRPKVLRRIGAARARFLSLAGRDVRQEARKLLGNPAKKSKPRPAGQPPRVHSTDERVTLRNILFHASGKQGVIVGPVKLNQVNQSAGDLGSLTVPKIQEEGGVILIREVSIDDGETWWRRDLRRTLRPWEIARTRKATYKARPFMRPALARRFKRWQQKRKAPGLTIGPEGNSVQIGPS